MTDTARSAWGPIASRGKAMWVPSSFAARKLRLSGRSITTSLAADIASNRSLRDPISGIGKPEPLRHMLAGAWSRRITEEHRLVYLVDGDDDLVILQARFHYD